MRVDGLIIVSNVAVNLSINALTGSIGLDVLMDVNVSMFVSAMTAFAFDMLDPLEEFRC